MFRLGVILKKYLGEIVRIYRFVCIRLLINVYFGGDWGEGGNWKVEKFIGRELGVMGDMVIWILFF